MNKIKRVYVAGPYNADNVVDVLSNMRQGMRLATKVLLSGFSPFTPWLDYQFSLMLHDDESLTIDDYYRYSMVWLEVSDAVLLVPNYEKSKGTFKEIERAKELNIPIFHSLDDIEEWNAKVDREMDTCKILRELRKYERAKFETLKEEYEWE